MIIKTTDYTTAVSRLAAALDESKRAKQDRPEDNPFASHDLKSMATAGLMKSADLHPARNMAVVGEPAGYEMERARFEGLEEAQNDSSLKRKATARARAQRKAQFDAIANSPAKPSEERMQMAWAVMAHLFPTVVRIADGKRRWAGRFLGDVADDVGAAVLENMALMLAKSDEDLVVLEIAASEIGSETNRTGMVPGDQLTDDEKKERKRIRRARKWLMQVVNNRVMDTMIDVYFRSHNLKAQNIDIVATVMANINGVGDDPLTDRFKADRAPAFMGTRFQRPDGIDGGLLAAAINAAIGDRRLDPMVELLLNTRTDGAFEWSEQAEQVFLTDPDGAGEWLWRAVIDATTGRNRDGKEWTMDRARKARGDAARQYVRNTFEWLPGFIVDAVNSFDQQFIGWSTDTRRAVLASDFESYLPERTERREFLQPALRFTDSNEAAQALIEHLALLTTGEDLLRSVRHA